MENRFRFRAWDKEIKSMVSDAEFFPFFTIGDINIDDKYILMQCTGLKDRNGKLIYEGDIIEWKKENHIVIFDERNATFGIKISDVETYLFNDIHTPTRWVEVIGNIYENKELLKEDKNENKRLNFVKGCAE